MNKVILCGNITKDLEIRKTQNNKSVLDFTIATNEGKTQSGQEVTQFTGCRAWEKVADNIAQYFRKGSKILIEGRIRTDCQETQNGKRYWTYVLVDRFEFVQSAEQNAPQNTQQQPQSGYPTNGYQSNGYQNNGYNAGYQQNNGYNQNAAPSGDYVDIKTDDLPFY